MIDEQPKLCINCKHIGTNGAGDPLRFKCFAPGNIIVEKTDLVTGALYKVFHNETCYMARSGYDGAVNNCGNEGKWFEEKPPVVAIMPNEFTAPARNARKDAADLLSQLDKMP